MPVPRLDPRDLYGPEARYLVDWINDELGYDTIIDPTLLDRSVKVDDETGEIRLRPPRNTAWFHSLAGRAGMTIIGKLRGELWFPEFSREPHLQLIEGGAS